MNYWCHRKKPFEHNGSRGISPSKNENSECFSLFKLEGERPAFALLAWVLLAAGIIQGELDPLNKQVGSSSPQR